MRTHPKTAKLVKEAVVKTFDCYFVLLTRTSSASALGVTYTDTSSQFYKGHVEPIRSREPQNSSEVLREWNRAYLFCEEGLTFQAKTKVDIYELDRKTLIAECEVSESGELSTGQFQSKALISRRSR